MVINLYRLGVRMMVLVLLLVSVVPVMAQAGPVVIANDNLSLRAAPTRDSERLATIPYRAELTVTAISPDRAWLAVTYNGQGGWVSLAYVAMVSGSLRTVDISSQTFLRGEGAVHSNVMVSPVANLNYRTEPTFEREPAGVISYQETLPALALSADGVFVLVHYHGHDVWVYREYLEVTFGSLNDFAPGAAAANVGRPVDLNAEVWTGLQGACAGVGIPAAAAYDGGPGVHSVMIYPARLVNVARQAFNWNEQLGGWAPGSPVQTQLVVCVSEQRREVIQQCRYEGPDIYRFQYSRDVRIVAAQSGEILAEARLDGMPPRECQQSERWSLTRLYGEEVSFAQLQAWIQPYVAP